jgi:hypothetical protein
MKLIRNVIAAAALVMVAAPASANEVLATTVDSGKKGGAGIALDIVSDGKIAGFSFVIEIPGLDEKSVNLKACLADLPKGFSGGCNATKGAIYVIAASDRPELLLPSGVVSVGKVYFSRALDKGAAIQVKGAEFSDNNANSVTGTAKVLAE